MHLVLVALLWHLIESGRTFCLLTLGLTRVYIRSILVWISLWMLKEEGKEVKKKRNYKFMTRLLDMILRLC